MKIYDLSIPFSKDTLVFPGTPKMDYVRSHTVQKDHYNLGIVSVNTHAGTHTDAPLHFIEGGASLADVDVGKYVGEAVVIDCSQKKAFDLIDVADVASYEEKIKRCKRVIIKTGWSKFFEEDKFFTDYPIITVELAKWLAAAGVVLLGVEPPSLNPADYIEVHKTLLESGIAVVEGLTNLESLPSDEIFFVGTPLALKDGDGFPIRALALEF